MICPRFVADMRTIEAQAPNASKEKMKFVLVIIGPEADTPGDYECNTLTGFLIILFRNNKSTTPSKHIIAIPYHVVG